MDEPRLEELLSRIETLEREKRRWKVIGIGALSVVLVLVVLGGLFAVGSGLLIRSRYVEALRAEREAVMRERDAAEQARQAMEAEQRARQATEKKVKEDNQ